MLAEIVVSMGDKLIVSDARGLTSQWDFVTRSIARVENRLRRDLILLGYKDSLLKRNLGVGIVLSWLRLGFFWRSWRGLRVRRGRLRRGLES